jgi:hypothetical protein
MGRILPLFSLLFLLSLFSMAQKGNFNKDIRVYKSGSRAVSASINFSKKYIPGQQLSLTADLSWDGFDMVSIEFVAPEGVSPVSASDIGSGYRRLAPTIASDSIVWESGSSSGYYDWYSPEEMEMTLSFDESLSGELVFPFKITGPDGEVVELEIPIAALKNAATLVLKQDSWYAPMAMVNDSVLSVDAVKIYNDGAAELTVSAVEGLTAPMAFVGELPVLGAQEDGSLLFSVKNGETGAISQVATVKTNGGEGNINLYAAYFDSTFALVDFENAGVQFPPVGWEIDAFESGKQWESTWGEIKFSSSSLDSTAFVSPAIDLSAISGDFIGFNLEFDDDTQGVLRIEYQLPGDDNWTMLEDSISRPFNSEGQVYYSLDAIDLDCVKIRIKAVLSSGYVEIDNIRLPKYYNPETVPMAGKLQLPANGETNVMLAADFAWNKVLYADGYKVYIDTLPNPVKFFDVKDTARFSTDLLPLRYYYWKVVPYNVHGDAIDCPVWSFKTEQYVPTAFTAYTDLNTKITFKEGEKYNPLITMNKAQESFVSWYATEDGNINLKLQYLDKHGKELFRRNGLTVSAHEQSSWISKYDMELDSAGNAMLVLSDIRNGDRYDFTVYKVSPEGEMLWGKDGVTLSEDVDEAYFLEPQLIQDSKGNVYAYGKNVVTKGIGIARLGTDGQNVADTLFPIDGEVVAVAMDKKDQLVVGYYQSGTFYYQKYDSAFSTVGEAVAISTKPTFPYYGNKVVYLIPDKNNGVYAVWQGALGWKPAVKWQYADSEGNLTNGEEGAMVSLNEARGRAYPQTIYNQEQDNLIITWDEQGDGVGLYAQVVDKDGNISFDENGKSVLAISDTIAGTDGVAMIGDTIVWLFSNFDVGSHSGNYLNAMALDMNFEAMEQVTPTVRYSSVKNSKPLDDFDFEGDMLVMSWLEARDADGDQVYVQNMFADLAIGNKGADTLPPFAMNVDVLTNNKILVKFNEALMADSVEIASKYSVEGAGTAIVAKVESVTPAELLFTVDGMEEGTQKLFLTNVSDILLNVNQLDSIAFDFVPDYKFPSVVETKAVDNNKVVIRFSEPVKENVLYEPFNYASIGFEVNKVFVASATQLVLTTNVLEEKEYSIVINRFEDLMGNVVADSTVSFAYAKNTGSLDYMAESFNNGIPAEFALYDLDGNTPIEELAKLEDAWTAVWGSDDDIEAASISAYENGGQSDDWMITPAVQVKKGTYLKWEARAESPQFPDGYEIWVSTKGSAPEDFDIKVFSIGEEHYETKTRTVDLSAFGFGDEEIYVAFRNNSIDKYILVIDDIELYTPLNNDAALVAVSLPQQAMGGSVLDVNVTIANRGLAPLNSIALNWALDGGEVHTDTIKDLALEMGFKADIMHTATLNLPVEEGTCSLKVWTSAPNTYSDENPENDVIDADIDIKQGYQQRLVLIEHFTNTGCAPCAAQNPILDALIHNGNAEKVAHITYHVSWPDANDQFFLANTGESTDRTQYYEVGSAPEVFMGGKYIGGPGKVNQSGINGEYALPGYVKVEALAKYKAETIDVEVTTTNLADFSQRNIAFTAVITQDYELAAPTSNGETKFPNVMRKMLPDAAGEQLSMLDSAGVNAFSYSYTMPDNLVLDDVSVYYFVQDRDSKEILMAGTVDLVNTVSDNRAMARVAIYPNPSSDYLSISADNAIETVEIINVNGEVVMAKEASAAIIHLNVKHIAEGAYWVRVISHTGVSVGKFVKQ